MKTILASLLISVSLLSPVSAAAESGNSGDNCYTPTQNIADGLKFGWVIEKELKGVDEDGDLYSSVQIFSDKTNPGVHVVVWFVDGCYKDSSLVTSDFVQEYIEKYVH